MCWVKRDIAYPEKGQGEERKEGKEGEREEGWEGRQREGREGRGKEGPHKRKIDIIIPSVPTLAPR